jgi:hypothetical protein
MSAQTPQPPLPKRQTFKFSIPMDAVPILRDFMRRVGFYATEGELAESTVAYALWCEQMHHLTGPSFRDRHTRAQMWREIVADYGKPKKSGSFFEHRLEEIAAARTQKKKK